MGVEKGRVAVAVHVHRRLVLVAQRGRSSGLQCSLSEEYLESVKRIELDQIFASFWIVILITNCYEDTGAFATLDYSLLCPEIQNVGVQIAGLWLAFLLKPRFRTVS